MVKLCKNGENKTYGIHILVARAFIPNPNNLPEVNHLDRNRKNNCVENLEWCTHHENVLYSARFGAYKRYGEKNSNYGNRKLSVLYKEHPEKAICQSRPGSKNGRAIAIIAKNEVSGEEHYFSYIRECVGFLKAQGYINKDCDENAIATRIKIHTTDHKPYKGFTYKCI